jgi:hypothetical protein
MRYNLEVLNDKEFEDLCKALLDVAYGVDFQIFKAGKDNGIDLLYSGSVEHEIVVQVKHYASSSFPQLRQTLKKDEIESVRKLSPIPKRYVLATSLSLSPKLSKEIQSIMDPFIRSLQDIFGRTRIENMLSKNKTIEERFFKLWLTSTVVLKRILHNAAAANSEFHKQKILDKSKKYVENKNLHTAVDMLMENKFLIISGLPGVGKTTLAYMLICERMAFGCELVYGDGKISEVEGLLSNDDRKQIFFIDDFLGANLYDIQHPKNPENKIISFVDRIKQFKNKYLVLTSRTTILNQAIHRFEHLRRSGLAEDSNYELRLAKYSLYEKAKILYNHLYYANLATDFIAPFFKKEVYAKIIQHPNYFPRTVEYITDMRHFKHSGFDTVEEFIFNKLDFPDEIWKHAFQEQLEQEDRILVMTLLSLGGQSVADGHLQSAFAARYDFEVRSNNIQRKPQVYKHAVRKLLDGFIVATQDADSAVNSYSFVNPSVMDYLLTYLAEDDNEQFSILCALVYCEQFTFYFGPQTSNKVEPSASILKKTYDSLLDRRADLQVATTRNRAQAIMDLFLMLDHQRTLDNEDLLEELFEAMLKENQHVNSFDLSIFLVENEDRWTNLKAYLTSRIDDILSLIIQHTDDISDLKYLTEISEKYERDFQTYLDTGNNETELSLKLGTLFEILSADFSFDEINIADTVYQYGEDVARSEIDENLWQRYTEILTELDLYNYLEDVAGSSYDIDSGEIVQNALPDHYDDEDHERYQGSPEPKEEPIDDWPEIDRLFS